MKFWTIDFGAHVRFIQRANLRRWNFELIKSFKLCFVLRFGFASVFSSISSCVYLVTCDNQYTWIVIECWILFERVGYPSPPPLEFLPSLITCCSIVELMWTRCAKRKVEKLWLSSNGPSARDNAKLYFAWKAAGPRLGQFVYILQERISS